MKKALSLICVLVLLITVAMPFSAAAADNAPERSVSVEYLDDGSYFVVEVVQNPQSARASYKTSGSKTSTYYTASGSAVWNVTVYGEFTYTTGVSAKATSSTATVGIIDRNASFVSKNAYTLGSAAFANATVSYRGDTTNKTISLTCDSYGHLS